MAFARLAYPVVKRATRIAAGLVTALALSIATPMAAATSPATIIIGGLSQSAETGSMTFQFNNTSQTLRYDRTSTPASVAAWFAVRFSLYSPESICASAKGDVITLRFKGPNGYFTAFGVSSTGTWFSARSDGFLLAKRLRTFSNIGNTPITIPSIAITGQNTCEFRSEMQSAASWPPCRWATRAASG